MSYYQAGGNATAAKLNGQPGRTPVGGQYRITTIATANNTTEVAFVTTDVLALDANSLYVVTYQAQCETSTSTPERWIQRIRKSNVSGTQLAVKAHAPATDPAEPIGDMQSYMYPTTSAENTAFCGTWARDTSNAGTIATADVLATYIIVEKLVFLNGVMETA